MNIDFIEYKEKYSNQIAIVAIGYNRLKSLSRLLSSLRRASYNGNEAPLVISIDCSGNEELYDYVRSFDWPFGDKIINIQKERLGLKRHIFQCAELSNYFKAVILLEDDTFVSPYFYSYVQSAVEKYGNDERIAEIALYCNEMNGYASLPFEPIQTGSDTILMQDVCTSGECFTASMWNGFMRWMSEPKNENVDDVDMQPGIKKWRQAWSKYYNAYVCSNKLYVVYPRTAVTTNFNDLGVHGIEDASLTQVNLSYNKLGYRMVSFEDLPRYDIFCNNEETYKWLNIAEDDLCLDYYGTNPNIKKKRYVLSTKVLPYKIVRGFSLSMKPIELNVKEGIQGDEIRLYDTFFKTTKKTDGRYTKLLAHYFLKGFSNSLLFRETLRQIKLKIQRTCGLKK